MPLCGVGEAAQDSEPEQGPLAGVGECDAASPRPPVRRTQLLGTSKSIEDPNVFVGLSCVLRQNRRGAVGSQKGESSGRVIAWMLTMPERSGVPPRHAFGSTSAEL
jgi:hypothetical protein